MQVQMQPNNQSTQVHSGQSTSTSSTSTPSNTTQSPQSTSISAQQQLPLASQVQIRSNLTLKQIDSSAQLNVANQPLSPTNQAISAANRQQQNEQKSIIPSLSGPSVRQTVLKGLPQQLVGLTTLEYQPEERSLVQIEDFQTEAGTNNAPFKSGNSNQINSNAHQTVNLNHFYLNQLYDEKSADFPFREQMDFQNPNENYSIVKLRVHMPVQMSIEHIEMQLNQANFEIFSKYLKFLRVESVNPHLEREYLQLKAERQEILGAKAQNQYAQNMQAKSKGFIDRSLQKALLEGSLQSQSQNSNAIAQATTISFGEQERGLQKLHLKSGFLDSNKKILELHTCGVSQVVNFVFLYYKKRRPTADSMRDMTDSKKERLFSKTMNLSSEKMGFGMKSSTLGNMGNIPNFAGSIKSNNFLSSNELLPLLNCLEGAVGSGDEDIDELDDEVAMISNKQSMKQAKKTNKNKPTLDDLSISHEEIKIEMINTNLKANNKNQLKKITKDTPTAAAAAQIQQKNSNGQQKQDQSQGETEETRNFNTLPRNYSDPSKKQDQKPGQANNSHIGGANNQSSYLDMEFNSQYNENGNNVQNDNAQLQESSNMQLISQSEIFNFVEQEIFLHDEQDREEEERGIKEMQRLLARTIQTIKISGFNTNNIPAVTNLAYYMNNSFLLKQKQLHEHAAEYDFLCGVLMVSFKKLTQAAEQFRKIQYAFLTQIDEINQKTLNMHQSQTVEQQTQVRVQKLYLKCAILELLTCEALCQPNQVNEKMQSVERMVKLSQFEQVSKLTFLPIISHSDDPFSVMKKFLPQLLKFVVMCLTHKKEIVRISALKLIEYILETKGCSLDLAMVFILKALLKTYPNPNQYTIQSLQNVINLNILKTETQMIAKGTLLAHAQQFNIQDEENKNNNQVQGQTLSLKSLKKSESFSIRGFTQSVQEFFQYEDYRHLDELEEGKKEDRNLDRLAQLDEVTPFSNLKEPTSGFLNAMKSAYNHTLETYISVLSSISSHILHQLFYEVILTNIVDPKESDTKKKPPAPQLNSEKIIQQMKENNQQDSKADKLKQQQQQHVQDAKLFSIKIAEKIITICQGDLFLTKEVLEYFIDTVVQKPSASSNSETVLNGIRNLWQSIRSKVFTNYSQKGMRILIEWMVDKMSHIAQNAQINAQQTIEEQKQSLDQQPFDPSKDSDIARLEITDEDSQQLLQLFDIVSMIASARKNNEAEANALIKIKSEYCLELYILINPLMFWLDVSVEREERFPLFKSVYQTIKEVLDNLPPRRNDIDLFQIMEPILSRTKDFLKNNSPSLQMLKFLEIVLRDIKQHGYAQDSQEIQQFFLEMLENFVPYISYCLHEEVFSVFDKLFTLCSDQMSEKVVTKCISAMIDKYTLKNRGHKTSMTLFMKNLLEVSVRQRNSTLEDSEEELEEQISIRSKNNYFDIVCNFCFFQNQDPFPIPAGQPQPKYREDFKSLQDIHDQYVDKLQFFMDLLSQLTEVHVSLFAKFISHPEFSRTLLNLLNKGEINLRLKCHEILEITSNYYIQHCPSKTVYRVQQNDRVGGNNPQGSAQQTQQANQQQQQEVMEVQYINHERLHLAQVMLHCIIKSLESGDKDSYLQFNALILLDYLFQHMLPVPSYQNEIQRERINRGNSGVNRRGQNYDKVFDLQHDLINQDSPEFEVTSVGYTLMRVDLIFKLWQHVFLALNSPWSNIRSICYGLICSMLKIDVQYLATLTLPSNPSYLVQSLIGQEYVQKLKTLVLPMLFSLLSSKESESKAGGLNILGSFCGLSYDFSKVKISRNMDFFKKNSTFISSRLWQLVFELQEDWDITIKEASVVLIQLCAPRNAVKYFDKTKRDVQEKRFSSLLSGFCNGLNLPDNASRISSSRMLGEMAGSHNMIQPSLSSIQNSIQPHMAPREGVQLGATERISDIFVNDPLNMHLSSNNIFDRIGDTIRTNQTINNNKRGDQNILRSDTLAISDLKIEEDKANTLDEEIRKYERQEFRQQQMPGHLNHNQNQLLNEDPFEFFVDRYQDEQIQEIISIFRNDFKPPKSLWIEKAQANVAGQNSGVLSGTGPDYYAEIYPQAIDQFNQQQAYLQQKQQQEQQQMVNNSPRNAQNRANNMVDALEDDLVKKFEKESQEKQKYKNQQQATNGTAVEENKPLNAPVDNFKIFERHYEDDKEQQQEQNSDKEGVDEAQNQPQKLQIDTNIDGEPFQFLDDSPGKILPINDSPSLQNPHLMNPTGAPHMQQSALQTAAVVSQTVEVQQVQPAAKKAKKTKKSKDDKKQRQVPQLDNVQEAQMLQQPISSYSGPAYKHERTPVAINSSQFQLALQHNMQHQSNPTSQHQSHSNLAQQQNYGTSILTSQQQHLMTQLDNQLRPNEAHTTTKAKKKSTTKDRHQDERPTTTANKDKMTTDELIEEYERKITITKQKLEEEQKKQNKAYTQQQHDISTLDNRLITDLAAKSTPEFKNKNPKAEQPHPPRKNQSNLGQIDDPLAVQMMNAANQRSAEKKKSYLTQNIVNLNATQPFASGTLFNMAEQQIPKGGGYFGNLDNNTNKLLKQINNCFNDNSYNNISIGPVVMTAQIGGGGGSSKQHKQKLNKSFENILASKQYNLKHGDAASLKHAKQKNLSSSPRRGSSSGKKSGSIKSNSQLNNNKKKYLDQPYNLAAKNQQKALRNMKDFNYYIQTIEKEHQTNNNNQSSNGQSDKLKINNINSLNLKDFNSMPTTPTSILKKVEDQMKAISQQSQNAGGINPLSKMDIKAQMSNTCPNIAQVLSQIDSMGGGGNSNSGNLMNSNFLAAKNQLVPPSQHTPSNVQNQGKGSALGLGHFMPSSSNQLSGQSLGTHNNNMIIMGGQLDKQFTFSQTQKIDIKEATKSILTYSKPREGHTAREPSYESKLKSSIGSKGLGGLLVDEAQKIKALKAGVIPKRSRGSQEKYLTQNFQGTQGIAGSVGFIAPGTASHSKLNKSLNNISQGNTGAQASKKKEQLSKSLIGHSLKNDNMSPKDKKYISHMMNSKLLGGAGSALNYPQSNAVSASMIQQHNSMEGGGYPLNNQYSYSSNLLYDYIASSEQGKRPGNTNRTPVKKKPQQLTRSDVNQPGGMRAEILEASPSNFDKNSHFYQSQRPQNR